MVWETEISQEDRPCTCLAGWRLSGAEDGLLQKGKTLQKLTVFHNISSQHELNLRWPQDAEAARKVGEAVSSIGLFWAWGHAVPWPPAPQLSAAWHHLLHLQWEGMGHSQNIAQVSSNSGPLEECDSLPGTEPFPGTAPVFTW